MLFTTWLILDLALLTVPVIYFIYRYSAKKFSYWEKRGVYSPPTIPLFGNFLNVVLLRVTAADWIKKYYDEIKGDFFGIYCFDSPYFVVKDPKLVRNVLLKDFNHFVDRNIAAPDHSPVTKHMQFFQKGTEWKNSRSKMSVAFSSGKIKIMFPMLTKTSEDLKEYLLKNQRILEVKEVAIMFTTDVISKCAFGINSHCFADTDSEFRAYGRKIFDFSLRNAFAQFVYFFKPNWVHKLKLEFIHQDTMNYFTSVFMKALKARGDNTRYNDLVDIANDMKKNNELQSDGSDDLTFCGTAMQFFIAGSETTGATISFTLYEFALNLEIQNKAREEVFSVLKKYGSITYDAICDMPYLDMCINETLRKYPVLVFLDRKCTLEYQVPGTQIVIEKGTPVLIPVYGLHMDPKLFPEPYTYDPERFRAKVDNTKGVYFLPFGEGQRNCLGERFGKLSAKLAIISIIKDFELTTCADTPNPIVYEPKSFLLQSDVGLPIKFTSLQQ